MLTWLALAVIAGTLLAIIWASLAAGRQQRVFGPEGQSSFTAAWVIALVIYGIAVAGLYVAFIEPRALAASMNDIYYYGAITGLGLLGVAAFWGGTGSAASAVMRPSVPGATWR